MKNEINEFNDTVTDNGNGDGKNKYFSFGLSIIDNEKNADKITELKTVINNIREKTGNVGTKNVIFIERLIRFVDTKLNESDDTENDE